MKKLTPKKNRTLHVKGVERGLEMVLAVFPSAQFPGKQVLKMKRVSETQGLKELKELCHEIQPN